MVHCVEGAFDASSRGTPKLKNGVPQDELKNGCGCVLAVPYKSIVSITPYLSGTESAILNRESGDSESCGSNHAIPESLY